MFAVEPRPTPPAEELRLNTVQFREWLKARGLTELLDLHLRDFPPTDPTATLLMMRDVKLAQFADRSRSIDERRAAVAEANRILEQLAADHPQDRRRLTWQYTLAYSLLYDEAESYATNILYFGGAPDDRNRLSALTARALETARSLTHFIAEEYARIDRLTAEEFEDVERRGYLEELDRLGPSADYLLLWILFYDALPRRDDDPIRAAELREIIDTLAVKPAFLQTPHDKSRIQVQASVLLGMTHRRVNDHAAAREHLDRAVNIADRLADQPEKARVRWASNLAMVETVRNDRDDGRLDAALAGAARLRDAASSQGDSFALRFSAALLERSVYRARTAAQEKAGRMAEAKAAREQAWMTLAKLVNEHPDRKETVYSLVYNQVPPDTDAASLDPFEQCAVITGLIAGAGRRPEESADLLARAIKIGEYWLAHPTDNSRLLAPEVLFELGVAQHRLGDRAAAARRLLQAASEYPRSPTAFSAATLAVQLAGELHDEQRGVRDIDRLYREAMETLLTHHGDTDAGRYWRFFYAQFLDESGEHATAGPEYAKVYEGHEHYLESGFFAVRAACAELQRLTAEAGDQPAVLALAADKVTTAYRSFAARVGHFVAEGAPNERTSAARRLLSDARVLTAEAMLLKSVGRAEQALEMVADMDKAFVDQPPLAARVWRVRLLALQALGRLSEAGRVLPQYVSADPAHAGATLQTLYLSLSADAEQARSVGGDPAARPSAELALLLAEQLTLWAEQHDPSAIGMDRQALRVQLAEAHLRAGNAGRAQQIFDETASVGPSGKGESSTALLTTFGQAEAAFQQSRYAEALPKYNRLATTLAADHPLRWKSLLRDLQCRTALGEPPAGILKVIEQQKFLFPDLGGVQTAAEFERLKRENERR